MSKLKSAFLICATALSINAFACGDEHADSCKMIHAKELATMISGKTAKLAIFDANNAETRAKYGVIPGAKLLSSSSKFDAKELPADKDSKLVFYCANTMCQASHHAAQKAEKAGFKEVFVMSDGIQGWKKIGQATAPATTKVN